MGKLSQLLQPILLFVLLNVPSEYLFVRLLVILSGWIGPENPGTPLARRRNTFLFTCFALLAAVARASGRITDSERNEMSRQIREKMALTAERESWAQQVFEHTLRRPVSERVLARATYASFRRRPTLLNGMAELFLELAGADHQLEDRELLTITAIVFEWDLPPSWFRRKVFELKRKIELSGDSSRAESYESFEESAQEDTSPLSQAYQTLGVEPTSSFQTVKKAYRKLVREHHPDRAIAEGLPPHLIEKATERFKEIQTAYELIEESVG